MANRLRGWRPTPTGAVILLMAAAILAASLIHRVNLLLLVFSLMLSLLTMGVLVGRRQLRRVRTDLFIPPLISAGKPAGIELAVTCEGVGGSWGLSVDVSAHSPGHAESVRVPINFVPARQTSVTRFVMTFRQRGIYRLQSPRISTSYPFGFIRWWRSDVQGNLPSQVVAYPAIGALTHQALKQLGFAHLHDGRSSPGLVEGIDEFRGVREFREGDSPRLIHWRSTARRGQFVVRELDPPASGGVLFIVDLRSETSAGREQVEPLLSFVASLLMYACRRSSLPLVLAILGNEPTVIRGQMNSQSLEGYLRALAVVQVSESPGTLASIRGELRPSDTRDRSIWAAGLSPLPWEDARVLVGRRLSPQRLLLNVSADMLDDYWIPPDETDGSP